MRDELGRFTKGHPTSNTGRTHWKIGRKTWNEGLTKENNIIVKQIADKNIGNKNCEGRHQTEKTKNILSIVHQGKHHSPSTEFKKNHIVPLELRKRWSKEFKGQHRSPNTEWKKGQNSGEKSPSWKGGISFEPYGKEFNKELKDQIKKRDNFTCQECGFLQNQLEHKLVVHHIDFNKKNNNHNNLITLCRSCHSQTQWNREDWINYFQKKVEDNDSEEILK